MLKTFPDPDIPRFENGDVGSRDISGKFVYMLTDLYQFEHSAGLACLKGESLYETFTVAQCFAHCPQFEHSCDSLMILSAQPMSPSPVCLFSRGC